MVQALSVVSLSLSFYNVIVIHQYGIFQTFINEPGFTEGTGAVFNTYTELMTTYGDRFRSFLHGVIHGVMARVLLVSPILTVKSIFERKSFKYIAINAGYWIIILAIIGAIVL